MKYHRIGDPKSLEPVEIEKLIEDRYRVVVQFSKSGYPSELLKELNELSKRLDTVLRYGFLAITQRSLTQASSSIFPMPPAYL